MERRLPSLSPCLCATGPAFAVFRRLSPETGRARGPPAGADRSLRRPTPWPPWFPVICTSPPQRWLKKKKGLSTCTRTVGAVTLTLPPRTYLRPLPLPAPRHSSPPPRTNTGEEEGRGSRDPPLPQNPRDRPTGLGLRSRPFPTPTGPVSFPVQVPVRPDQDPFLAGERPGRSQKETSCCPVRGRETGAHELQIGVGPGYARTIGGKGRRAGGGTAGMTGTRTRPTPGRWEGGPRSLAGGPSPLNPRPPAGPTSYPKTNGMHDSINTRDEAQSSEGPNRVHWERKGRLLVSISSGGSSMWLNSPSPPSNSGPVWVARMVSRSPKVRSDIVTRIGRHPPPSTPPQPMF